MSRLLFTITIVVAFLWNASLNRTAWYHPVLIALYVVLVLWLFYIVFVVTYRWLLKLAIKRHRFHTAARLYRQVIEAGLIDKGRADKLFGLIDIALPRPVRRVPIWLLAILAMFLVYTCVYLNWIK